MPSGRRRATYGLLTPSATAIEAAAGTAGTSGAGSGETADSFYSVARINGIRAMVLTEPLAPGLAIQVAEPLTATDQEVATVGATLALLSAVGVLAATLLGWAVARAGLAPVARLASVAEEVTLTGDPGRRVEVPRRDELGRLAASFNAMLSALQRSLDAQRRLVSDASHELRTPLASLRLNADLLAAHPEMPAAERAEVLDRVAGQAAELSRAGRQRDRPGQGRAAAEGAVAGPARRGDVRGPGSGPAGLAADGVRRGPGRLHGLRKRRPPSGGGQEPARQRGQVRPARGAGAKSGWPMASSPCATTAPA